MSAIRQASAPATPYDAIIIGAGFSGLYQLHKLRDELGLKARVLEAGGGVGGTWYWNRYPGARCDSESFSYSYSFSKELEQDWEWSERYPSHEEIRRYLNHVADRFDLRRDIQLNTRVKGAAFDSASDLWTVTTEAGESFVTRFLITAVGCISAANVPDIPGRDSFAGQWYHTGRWPHEGVDFTGKRVGLIGTGSTGIQAAPVIAETASHLTVFQRTANFSIPARNAPLTPEFIQEIKSNYPALRELMRGTTNGHPFAISPDSALAVPEEERRARYERAWEVGGLRFRAEFGDLLTDKAANDTAVAFIHDKIREIVKDPAVAEKLIPRDHPFATKRPPVDTEYFETFNRDNVRLVDVKADPIEAIVPEGIRLKSGEIVPLDIIVFATGYDALTGSLLAMDIHGADGHSLREDWAAGPRTYLGLQAPHFPNMFIITGPGSPSVLCNMPVPIEQHVNWITDCIAYMDAQGYSRIETGEPEAEAWVAHVNEAANATLLPQAGSSWYLGANIPGKPRVFMPYAGGMARYASLCDEVTQAGYRGFRFSSGQAQRRQSL